MSIFKKIGQFFASLFNAAKRTYNKLSPEQQEALQRGSGLVAIINNNLSEAPAAVRKKIAEAFPNLDTVKLELALFDAANAFNLKAPDSIEDAIGLLQNYLQGLQGKAWAVASHSIASLLAVLFSPKETKVAAIVSLIEFVYQKFTKKSLD